MLSVRSTSAVPEEDHLSTLLQGCRDHVRHFDDVVKTLISDSFLRFDTSSYCN